MGLGLLGRGIGDIRFLAECGAELLVTDLKTREQLAPALERLKDIPNIAYVLGEHRLEDFRNRDLILKAASVPLNSPYIAEAEKHGIPIAMSAALLVKHAPAGVTFVGITGTKGKSTTTHLIYEILKNAYADTLQKVYLGGNVRDISTLPLLSVVKPEDCVVLELDSWQLQGFAYEKVSPHVAVFTNLFVDHMNYYADDQKSPAAIDTGMRRYFEDKANIFRFQKPEDVIIVGEQVAELVQRALPPGELVIAEAEDVPASWQPKIIGRHNAINSAFALHAARALGVHDTISRHVIETFEGVDGRLKHVGRIQEVDIYNDNNATVPEATIAALQSFEEKKDNNNIVLIMGGTDKGLDMQPLVDEIGKRCKAVVLLRESGTERIKKDIYALPVLTVEEADGMAACVQTAWKLCAPGDVLLFSPAFASFGKHFKNEYDRNDQFLKEVQKL